MHKLRGHHLICLHFFRGRGYNEEFIENIKRILKNISKVEGPDDVSDLLPALKGEAFSKCCPYNIGVCNYSPDSEKEVRELDSFKLKLLKFEVHDVVDWDNLKQKLPFIVEEWRNKACKDCDWRNACDL